MTVYIGYLVHCTMSYLSIPAAAHQRPIHQAGGHDHHPPKERLYWLHTDGSGRRRAEDGRMVHPPLGCVGVLEDALRAKERRPDLTDLTCLFTWMILVASPTVAAHRVKPPEGHGQDKGAGHQ